MLIGDLPTHLCSELSLLCAVVNCEIIESQRPQRPTLAQERHYVNWLLEFDLKRIVHMPNKKEKYKCIADLKLIIIKRKSIMELEEQVYNKIDEETGESLSDTRPKNAETGEPELYFQCRPCRKKAPFQIPKAVKNSAKEKSVGIEPVPKGISFGQTRPICLLLPAIIYCRWFLIILTILEAVLHMWAHRKNKIIKNESVFFRSPFHAITSEFCAVCQNEACMDTVGKIQQMRMHKFLKECDYMKKVKRCAKFNIRDLLI